MTPPIRVAGWGIADDGAVVTWTVSEGRKGRRWREVVDRAGTSFHTLLLETGPDGRFSHLELARANGLWTFHPEGDGTLHGNHVDRTQAGVRHVTGWPFGPADVLVVDGSPVSLAAIAFARRNVMAVGASVVVGAVVIDGGGGLRRDDAVEIERLSAIRWRIGDLSACDVDEDGLPILADAERRPLEVD